MSKDCPTELKVNQLPECPEGTSVEDLMFFAEGPDGPVKVPGSKLAGAEPGNSVLAIDDGPYYVFPGDTFTAPVLANDSDPEGDMFTITGKDDDLGPIGISSTDNGDGTFDFTIDPGVSPGTYTCDYTITDSQGATGTATITVVVSERPNSVVAIDDGPFDLPQGGTITFNKRDNDYDPQFDTFGVTEINGQSLANSPFTIGGLTITDNGDGTCNATAPSDQPVAPVVFEYTIEDSNGNTDTAEVTINVTEVIISNFYLGDDPTESDACDKITQTFNDGGDVRIDDPDNVGEVLVFDNQTDLDAWLVSQGATKVDNCTWEGLPNVPVCLYCSVRTPDYTVSGVNGSNPQNLEAGDSAIINTGKVNNVLFEILDIGPGQVINFRSSDRAMFIQAPGNAATNFPTNWMDRWVNFRLTVIDDQGNPVDVDSCATFTDIDANGTNDIHEFIGSTSAPAQVGSGLINQNINTSIPSSVIQYTGPQPWTSEANSPFGEDPTGKAIRYDLPSGTQEFYYGTNIGQGFTSTGQAMFVFFQFTEGCDGGCINENPVIE